MLITETSKSGQITASINGKYIHSRYNPQKEAEDFLSSNNFIRPPRFVIMIGAGIGYLRSAVKKHFPDAAVIPFYLNEELYLADNISLHKWARGCDKSITDLLSGIIPDFLITETVILKWRPCTVIFPDETLFAEKEIRQYFLERNGTIFTTGSFGKKWLRNIILNFRKQSELNILEAVNKPVVIAASGPTLSRAIPLIGKVRDRIFLLALPSSIEAFNYHNIRPDMIINTDPGYWAAIHLSRIRDISIPVAMPLSAVFQSRLLNPVILLNQGTFYENLMLNPAIPRIPPNGTVAGSALMFIRNITDQPIFFAGLDFLYDDVHEHVSPHSYDSFFKVKTDRLNSLLSILYRRYLLHSNTEYSETSCKPLDIYRGWFNGYRNNGFTYRLNPTKITLDSIPGITEPEFERLVPKVDNSLTGFNLKTEPLPDPEDLISKAHIFIKSKISDFESRLSSVSVEELIEIFSGTAVIPEVFQFIAYEKVIRIRKLLINESIVPVEEIKQICSYTVDFFNSYSSKGDPLEQPILL